MLSPCCQDRPRSPSPSRLGAPLLRPSDTDAAVKLHEVLQAGRFAVSSDVRLHPSVRAPRPDGAVHSPSHAGCGSASWLDHALRSPSLSPPPADTPPSQPGSSSVSGFEVVSSSAPRDPVRARPPPSLAAPPLSVPAALPRRWADGRPNSAYRPRGFAEAGPCTTASPVSLRTPVSSSTFSFSPPSVSLALRAPALPRGTLPAHLRPPVPRLPSACAPGQFSGSRLQPVSPASVHFPAVPAPAAKATASLSTAGRVQLAMSALSARWIAILLALASASALFVDCQASSNPEAHMSRAIAKFATGSLLVPVHRAWPPPL